MSRRHLELAVVVFAAAIGHGCAEPASQHGGDTLRYRLSSDPSTLDPAHSTSTDSAVVVLKVFEGLVRYEPETLEIVPAVAERFDVSSDGLTYTFRLRRGVRFHNGREVTAEDFRYSFERVLDPRTRSERGWVLEEIDGAKEFSAGETHTVSGINVSGKYELRLRLRRAFAPFLAQLCMEGASVVPREEVQKWGEDFTSHPVGCGPFRFVSWKHDVEVVLEAFDEYHGGTPTLRRIEFRVFPETSVALEEYLVGGLDVLDQVPPGRLADLREKYPDEIKIWPILATYYFGFNHQKEPFKGNRKLRQAFNYAIDREGICDVINEGVPVPASGILPPGVPGHNPDLKVYAYDAAAARRLLAEAGYPDGEGLPVLTLWYNTDQGHQRICEYVQHCLKKIGVRVKLKNIDAAAYWQALYAGEPAFFRSGWVADIPDPDNFLYTLLHSSQFGAAGNASWYSNPQFDERVEHARSAIAWPERQHLYREAETMAVEDAAWLFVYYYRDVAMFKPYVKGIRLSRQGDFAIPLHNVYIEGPR
jgi:peptide/nickel transport system substrate-binding protein/oligopeptide transport system substrate-binding protein